MASTLSFSTTAGRAVALSMPLKGSNTAAISVPVLIRASSRFPHHLPAVPAGASRHSANPWFEKHLESLNLSRAERSQSLHVCKATEEVSVMCEEIELETEEKMEKCIESVKTKFNSVRTGRASTALLDRVEVDYYGVPVILKSLANISTPDSATILIQPFDKSSIAAISKSLLSSDLNLTPANDGNVIRLNIPPLTGDRRKELVKTIGKLAEDGRIAIRNVRRDAIKKFEKLEKDGELSEDNLRDYEDTVQKATDNYVKKVDALFKAKEKDILQV